MEATLKQAIKNALGDLGINTEMIDFAVEHPADISHGDYACNVAMVVAKQVGQAPRTIAEQLCAALVGKIEQVEKIDVAGPGFLNFHLRRDFFGEKIASAREQGEAWGTNDTWGGKTVVVEYTDPNPFKEFHIGHLFTNAVGESIARLFVANGANTKRVNYQGDVGMHVASAIYGMQQLGFSAGDDFSAKDLGRAYAHGATAYKEDEQAAAVIKQLNKQIYERSDESVNALYDAGKQVSLNYFASIYDIIGTEFDAYFFESEAAPRGKEIVLAHPEVFVESDGARVFVGEEYGLHTRVFLNSEGLPTYEAKELALPKLKEERLGEYDHSIISTSNEIVEYFKVLKKALSFIEPELAEKTEHICHGTVRLASGKMSSRTGDVIAALDFIDEIKTAAAQKVKDTGGEADEATTQDVAIGAVKYSILRGSILQDSVFDKEKALSFEGDSGPYLQYTHARICSVLEKAAQAGVEESTQPAPPEPYEIERLLYRFPEVVEVALAERAPHKITGFLTELAGSFNTFYAQEQIADPADDYAPYKAALADAVRHTLKNGLWMLGIKAPNSM